MHLILLPIVVPNLPEVLETINLKLETAVARLRNFHPKNYTIALQSK
jgi:hypothetical protein